jgi:hypothetical protein
MDNPEKTEGAIRETGNIGYTRHRRKTNNTKNTTQKTEMMSNIDPTRGLRRARVLYKFPQSRMKGE